MRYFAVLILLFTLSESTSARPKKRRTSKNNAINFNLPALALGVVSVNYERLINRKHGFVPRVSVHTRGFDAFGLGLDYRYHFNRKMESFFLGVYYSSLYGETTTRSLSDVESVGDFQSHTIGANLGRRWVWNNGINMVFKVGGGHVFSLHIENQEEDFSFEELAIRILQSVDIELSVGYAV